MNHIVALLSRRDEDVTPTILSILNKIPISNQKAITIELLNGVKTYQNLPEKLEKSPIALVNIVDPILYNAPEQELSENFNLSYLKKNNSPYSIASISGDSLIIARDPVGTIPLYLGRNQKFYAISTHMKYLWAMGLGGHPIPPGYYYELSSQRAHQKKIRRISQPSINDESLEINVKILQRLLQKIIESMIPPDGKVALGFSGGIDSTILAYYLKQAEADVSLVCVGLEQSSEFHAAEYVAQSLDLPLNLYKYPSTAVKNYIKQILMTIEEYNPVNVGIGISLLWAANRALELGNTVFFSGGGADELFGGYHRYLNKPSEIAESMIFHDVVNSYKVNYERDHKVCQSIGLRLKVPYADIRLIEYGLSIPLSQKLPIDPSEPRKIVLRALAKKLGFPDSIAYKRKKAFQYSTGVNKVLLKIAKDNGMRLRDYLKTRFDEVKKDMLLEGPDDF